MENQFGEARMRKICLGKQAFTPPSLARHLPRHAGEVENRTFSAKLSPISPLGFRVFSPPRSGGDVAVRRQRGPCQETLHTYKTRL